MRYVIVMNPAGGAVSYLVQWQSPRHVPSSQRSPLLRAGLSEICGSLSGSNGRINASASAGPGAGPGTCEPVCVTSRHKTLTTSVMLRRRAALSLRGGVCSYRPATAAAALLGAPPEQAAAARLHGLHRRCCSPPAPCTSHAPAAPRSPARPLVSGTTHHAPRTASFPHPPARVGACPRIHEVGLCLHAHKCRSSA